MINSRFKGCLSVLTLLSAVSLQRTASEELPSELSSFFRPPPEYEGEFGSFRSPLRLENGNLVDSARDWQRRRQEILNFWSQSLGSWPPLIEKPEFHRRECVHVDGITRLKGDLAVGLDGEAVPAYLLLPENAGPHPAMVVVYYDAESGAGLGAPSRDFALQLARQGFVALTIGPPGAGFRTFPKEGGNPLRRPYFGLAGRPLQMQPLSALSYASANAHKFLGSLPDVDPKRIGIVGHSFGGKWAMFASCLYEKFACAVWSDPGVVFDERDRRRENPDGAVNYWEPWYLGAELGTMPERATRFQHRGLPSEANSRTGSYRTFIEEGHDLVELHALMPPRPFLVVGGTADRLERWQALNHSVKVNELLGTTNRVGLIKKEGHAPTPESNRLVYEFCRWCLKSPPVVTME